MPDSAPTILAPEILTPPDTDYSVLVFDQLLGPGWHHMLFGSMTEAASGSTGALGAMFSTLNAIILAILAVMFFYVLTVGVIGTSHEGQALGKKYNAVWTPIRGTLGVGLLTPLPWASGFSLFQAILLLFTWFGIGGADTEQRAMTEYARNNFGVMTAPALDTEFATMSKQLLAAGVVKESLIQQEEIPIERRLMATWVERSTDEFSHVTSGTEVESGLDELFARASEHTKGGSDGYWVIHTPVMENLGIGSRDLGVMVVSCVEKSDAYCSRRVELSIAYMAKIEEVAGRIVTNRPDGSQEPYNPSMLYEAERALAAGLREAGIAHLQSSDSSVKTRMDGFLDDLDRNGWIFLGSYHWSFAGIQEEVTSELRGNGGLAFQSPNYERLMQLITDNELVQGHLLTAQRLAASPVGVSDGVLERAADSTTDSGVGGALLWIGKQLNLIHAPGGIASWVMGNDPIAGLSSFGHTVTGAAQTLLVGYVGLKAAAAAGNAWANDTWGSVAGFFSGGATTALAAAGKEVLESLSPIILIILMALFVSAFALAYYLPAVPFMIWSLGTVSWVILVLEVLVAAPLWALAHALPDGDEGFTGGKGAPGYMLFLRVLLQPALMVAGFFFAMVLVVPLAGLLMAGFELNHMATGGGMSFILGTIAYLVMISVLMIRFGHKVFALPTWLPDHLMRWIGQSVHSLGETQDEQQINSTVAGVFAKVGNGVSQSAMGGASKGAAAGAGRNLGKQGETHDGGTDDDHQTGETGPGSRGEGA